MTEKLSLFVVDVMRYDNQTMPNGHIPTFASSRPGRPTSMCCQAHTLPQHYQERETRHMLIAQIEHSKQKTNKYFAKLETVMK